MMPCAVEDFALSPKLRLKGYMLIGGSNFFFAAMRAVPVGSRLPYGY
jgi:hypothetical protein